mgnify:CR=1 FL=1
MFTFLPLSFFAVEMLLDKHQTLCRKPGCRSNRCGDTHRQNSIRRDRFVSEPVSDSREYCGMREISPVGDVSDTAQSRQSWCAAIDRVLRVTEAHTITVPQTAVMERSDSKKKLSNSVKLAANPMATPTRLVLWHDDFNPHSGRSVVLRSL